MSSDLSAIHAQASAILEKLYNERGRPAQLNKAFIEDYFKLVEDEVDFDDEAEVSPLPPRPTTARLSQPQKGLTEVVIPSRSEKFFVSDTPAVRNIKGTSQGWHGLTRPISIYDMSNVNGVPIITIRTGSNVVVFVGVPGNLKVQDESGTGLWVHT